MKKLERRSIICLMLAGVLVVGLAIFVSRFVKKGGSWAVFYGNQNLYKNGRLTRGAVYDTNGELLMKNTSEGPVYNDDREIRESTVHIVGDVDENVSSSVIGQMKEEIIGYNLLTGTYDISKKSNDVKLTINASLSKKAYQALRGYNGFVGIYNYKTGEILTMVSKPTFDPINPPKVAADDKSGIYMNKIISSACIPGSTFKTVTAAAAIENMDTENFSYTCSGVRMINGEPLRCVYPHGRVDFHQALSKSCNGAFAAIGNQLGEDVMNEYVKKLGLTDVYDIDGIKTVPGSFEFPGNVPLNMGWACAGQYKDLVNPCSMMVFMGAVADDGRTAYPRLVRNLVDIPRKTDRMIEPSTAEELQEMMKKDVTEAYGEHNFPGLDIYAKTGTAETGAKGKPNSWFTGFIKNPGCPYAFVVCVEKGGYGCELGAQVANTVLKEAIREKNKI